MGSRDGLDIAFDLSDSRGGKFKEEKRREGMISGG